MSPTLILAVIALVAAGLWLGRQARLVTEKVAAENRKS